MKFGSRSAPLAEQNTGRPVTASQSGLFSMEGWPEKGLFPATSTATLNCWISLPLVSH
jgi:hypothetical protein